MSSPVDTKKILLCNLTEMTPASGSLLVTFVKFGLIHFLTYARSRRSHPARLRTRLGTVRYSLGTTVEAFVYVF